MTNADMGASMATHVSTTPSPFKTWSRPVWYEIIQHRTVFCLFVSVFLLWQCGWPTHWDNSQFSRWLIHTWVRICSNVLFRMFSELQFDLSESLLKLHMNISHQAVTEWNMPALRINRCIVSFFLSSALLGKTLLYDSFVKRAAEFPQGYS